ncbi:Smr/MutS family protein [bacterium]|nr:Smr/MutS family protein [bacterium]
MHEILKTHPAVESFVDAPPQSGGWVATRIMLKTEI